MWLRFRSQDLTIAPHEAAPLPRDVDVAVIGGGFTGLSAALTLRERGVSVAVLEAETVGFGASGRNGGMVLTGLKLPPQTLLRRYGQETARAMFAASVDAIDFVESRIARYRIACDFVRTGHLEVAVKAAHFDAFLRTAEVMRRSFGHRVKVVPAQLLSEEIGSRAFYGGLLDERSGGLDPARYTIGLADAAVGLGAAVCERARVERLERERSAWRVVTGRGDLAARNVLVATGAYGGRTFASVQRRLVPVGSYVIATAPLPQDVALSVIPRNRMVFDSKRLLHYFRLTPDRRMLFGGRAAFFPETAATTMQSARILQRDMVAMFPQLRDAEVEYSWGGTLDVTLDVMPHAGKLDGAYYAVGYAGHGVALATLLGAKVADAIVDGAGAHPFAQTLPAAPLGLYDGRPWFLPFVGAWQRVMDVID